MLAVIFDGIGAGEWLVLLAVVLVFVGPKRLPETARSVGRWYNKFRRAAESFKRQLMEMDTELDRTVREAEEQASKSIDDIQDEFSESEFNGSGEHVVDPDASSGEPGEPKAEEAAGDGDRPVEGS